MDPLKDIANQGAAAVIATLWTLNASLKLGRKEEPAAQASPAGEKQVDGGR